MRVEFLVPGIIQQRFLVDKLPPDVAWHPAKGFVGRVFRAKQFLLSITF